MREALQLFGLDFLWSFWWIIFVAICFVMWLYISVSETREGRRLNLPPRRILETWDLDTAQHLYTLQVTNSYGTYYCDTEFYGDAEWAKRNAKKLGCKIVKFKDSDNE